MPTHQEIIQNLKIKNIKGFVDFSLLDYPGEVSAIIFLGGCNMVCSYCHNWELLHPNNIEDLDFSTILEYLQTSSILTGVVVSGGEPTLVGDNLITLLKQLRPMGLKIKLDTNGTNFDLIVKLLDLDLIDYLAIDLKTDFNRYFELGCSDDGVINIKKLILYLKNSNFKNWELRSTCWGDFITTETLYLLKDWICGCPVYILQATNTINKNDFFKCVSFVKSFCNHLKILTRNVGVYDI